MRATRVEMRQYRAAFDDDSDDDRDSLAAAPLAGHARSTQSAGSTCASAAADNENDSDADDTPYHPVYMTAEYLRRAAKGVALARLTQLTIDATAAAGVTFSADGHLHQQQQPPPHDQQQQRSHSGGELRDDKIGTLENLELCPRLQVWNSSRFVLRMTCHISFFHTHSSLFFFHLAVTSFRHERFPLPESHQELSLPRHALTSIAPFAAFRLASLTSLSLADNRIAALDDAASARAFESLPVLVHPCISNIIFDSMMMMMRNARELSSEPVLWELC